MKMPSLLSAIVVVLILTSGCQKHYESTANNERTQSSSVASLADGLVVTPFGMMPQKSVHFIAQGYSLSLANGRLTKIETATEHIVEDYGTPGKLNFNLNAAADPANNYLPAASGWVAYSYWSNADTLIHPVTYFSTSWAVPSAPKQQSNQTLFLFNGMQNGTTSASYIIQPVLQWGASAAGGGKYWAIANWFVTGSGAYYSQLETVNTGTPLQGVIQLTSHSGARYNYNASFAGYPIGESLQINNLPQAWWCAETLETYGINNPYTQYPSDHYTAMQSIKMLQNSANAPLTWSTAKANAGAQQKAVVVSDGSPNGEVDLYFRK